MFKFKVIFNGEANFQKYARRNTRAVSPSFRDGQGSINLRDIAATVGMTPAALYHHFSDKEQLYLDVVGYAFKEKVVPLKSLLDGEGNPWDRLEAFVARFTRMLAKENDFKRLMQWVLLDSDDLVRKSWRTVSS